MAPASATYSRTPYVPRLGLNLTQDMSELWIALKVPLCDPESLDILVSNPVLLEHHLHEATYHHGSQIWRLKRTGKSTYEREATRVAEDLCVKYMFINGDFSKGSDMQYFGKEKEQKIRACFNAK